MSGDFVETSRPLLDWVLRTTWEASLIAALVLLAQHLLRGRVSARWRYNLWLLVVARLLLPAVPGTHYSPFNLVRLPQPPHTSIPALPAPVPAPAPVPRPQPSPLPPVRVMPVPGPAVEPSERLPLYLASAAAAPAPWLPAFEATPAQPEVDANLAPVAQPSVVTPAPVTPAPVTPRTVTPPELTASAAPRITPASPAPGSVREASPPAAIHFSAAPTPTAAVPWNRRVNWPALAAIAWFAGAAFVAARLAWVTFRLGAAVRALRPVRDPALTQLLAECAAQLRLRRLPEVLEAPDGFGPALVGLLRPRVVLPACVLRGSFHADELRLVLMHELAHLKRHDVAANWLVALLGVVHWFNPVLWLTFRRMRLDREMACDELVLSATAPGVARAYGPTLLKLLQTLSRRPACGPALPGMVGVLEGKPSIRRRIAMIARFDRSNRNSSPLYGVALSVLAGGVALTGAVRGQQSPEPEAPPEVRELSVQLARERDDDSGPPAEERNRERRERRHEAPRPSREEEDEARNAAREAEDEARSAAREAEDQARQAARESEDQAREAAQAAREQFDSLHETLAERQAEVQERAAEAQQAVAEAQRQMEERQAEARGQLEEARKAMAEARQQAAVHEQDLRRQLDEAKQALSEHQAAEPADGDDDAAQAAADQLRELTETFEEKERELAEAKSEREQSLREAEEELQQAAAEAQAALQEAQDEIRRAMAERQEAVQESARAVQEVAGELAAAQQQLAAAEQALAQVQGEAAARGELPPPAPEAPPAPQIAPAPELPPTPEALPSTEPLPVPAPPEAPEGPIVHEGLPGGLPGATPPAAPAAEPSVFVATSAAPAPSVASAAEPAGFVATSVVPPEPAAGLPAASAAAPAADPSAPAAPSAGIPAAQPAAPATSAGAAPSTSRPGAVGRGGGGYGAAMGGAPAAGRGRNNARGGYPGGYPEGYIYGGMGQGSGAAAAQSYPGGGYPGMGIPAMPGAAQPAAVPAGRIEDASTRSADARTSKALKQALPVNFEGIPLEEALRFVSDAAKVDVLADWKGLEAAGVNRDAAVSLTLRQGAPAEQVLTWILRAAGGDALGFAVDHGVVVVTTQERIDRMVITRAYPLGGLSNSGQAVEELVRQTVAPQSWRETGGPGAVRFFNQRLFVTATEPNHRQVERLLALMEAQNVGGPAAGMMPGMMRGMATPAADPAAAVPGAAAPSGTAPETRQVR